MHGEGLESLNEERLTEIVAAARQRAGLQAKLGKERVDSSVLEPRPRAADVHVSNLRRKIERDPAHPERIVTVRQVDYKHVG